jgi:hypothetical protein
MVLVLKSAFQSYSGTYLGEVPKFRLLHVEGTFITASPDLNIESTHETGVGEVYA